ncbi:TPA: sigma-70 family RNA polymerase sigma factor [Elizabethkingia anophelis]|uniref:RNA polymerase ECF family sigma subunit n=2 Tax=Flavobacteriaceae TaxID=49546 RepID=A0A4V3E7H9_9FLAO|nr:MULTISPECIES: sigma-70 family RNA polymerase sigma factor [Flavobacteriaceae]HBN6703688.1 sigma-70 family RNA polymerase sigma factor [Elizabethkingia anophelis]TDS50380.1 RNA polymerase ECF family sigma subunit [Myroides indicus]WLD23537.1 sigma-70 family RNA polymerase sigma factor [Flavobacterium dauae]SFN67745.1 RNA polymerase sigma-70 factor, ECF subfamily [Paenimyroides ummariense]HBN6708006.1 sigma-70 family RNA polymerase sigma factor [Elizabethkingia anophelis]
MDDLNTLNKKLFPYAYNILGNIGDCQDVIQEVLIKFNEKEGCSISNPNAYLIKSVINQAINLKKKNDRERQQKITLPEPIVTNQGESKIELDEILNYSMLVLLDTLNTKERAVLLLKEAFDYEHDDIAEILEISVENSRQILTRAKKKLKLRKPEIATSSAKDRKYLEKYVSAIRKGDVKTLEQILSDEVQVLADAGNKLQVIAELTSGIDNTIKLMTYVYENHQKDLEIKIEEINHQSALLFYRGTTLINCQIFELNPDGKITSIFSVVDPEKLMKI